jgi:chorismate mutase
MSRQDPAEDPVIQELREQISANDRAIIDAINRRLQLLERMLARKVEQGYALYDPARESRMLKALEDLNNGPISTDGLAEIYQAVLEVTQREAGYERAAATAQARGVGR